MTMTMQRSDGHEAIRDRIYEVLRENGIWE